MNNEVRFCTVGDKTGYFHCWAVRDGETYGIVEFAGFTRFVNPADIAFCDEANYILSTWEDNKNDKNRKH